MSAKPATGQNPDLIGIFIMRSYVVLLFVLCVTCQASWAFEAPSWAARYDAYSMQYQPYVAMFTVTSFLATVFSVGASAKQCDDDGRDASLWSCVASQGWTQAFAAAFMTGLLAMGVDDLVHTYLYLSDA